MIDLLDGLASIESDRWQGGESLELARAGPGRRGRLGLEYVTAAGRVVGGQWAPDGLDDLIQEMNRADLPISTADGLPLVLQPGGSDRRMPHLADLCSRPGHRLISHRPERRAVVHSPAGYYKVRDPRREEPLRAEARGVLAPRLLMSVPGVQLWEPLEGVSLLEAATTTRADDLGVRVGRTIRALHDTPTASDLPSHGPTREVTVVETWAERVRAFDRLRAPAQTSIDSVARRLLTAVGEGTLSHRDLHDGQFVIGDRVGVIDFDTVAVAEPALDLANLLVHLQLRVDQGQLTERMMIQLGEGIIEGYQPDAVTLARIPAYADATRLRLSCVYAFRPDGPAIDPISRLGEPPPGAGHT